MKTVVRLLKDDDAATMAEYALMVSLIAVVCITAVALVGQNTNNMLFQRVVDAL
jgi:pilus assembly protein Flp/PilA